MKWISVKDRLPEKDAVVITAEEDGSVRIGEFCGLRFYDTDCCGVGDPMIKPTHWMPWPEAPK